MRVGRGRAGAVADFILLAGSLTLFSLSFCLCRSSRDSGEGEGREGRGSRDGVRRRSVRGERLPTSAPRVLLSGRSGQTRFGRKTLSAALWEVDSEVRTTDKKDGGYCGRFIVFSSRYFVCEAKCFGPPRPSRGREVADVCCLAPPGSPAGPPLRAAPSSDFDHLRGAPGRWRWADSCPGGEGEA